MTPVVTPRMIDALIVLLDKRWHTPAGFARNFWPGKTWARSNGPWGLGPDASGRHGGRMLTRLADAGFVNIRDYGGGWEAHINDEGLAAIRRCSGGPL